MREIPKLLIGTFQNNNYQELLDVVKAGVECGFTGFDTAPSYGTEIQLGAAIKESRRQFGLGREDFYVSDKVDAWQMQVSNGDIRKFVNEAIQKMSIEYLDMLLIHWPVYDFLYDTWATMSALKNEGLVKGIGICNVRVRHLQELKRNGITPDYIQIERHPMRICSHEIEYCKNEDIKVMDYSPLCRMHPHIRESKALKCIAEKYGKNIGQVILRWHIDTGATPVFMSKKVSRIKENVEIFNFSLTQDEIAEINSLNENYKIFLESWGCPGF